MYTVIRLDSRKELASKEQNPVVFKSFKKLDPALKCAAKRNKMFTAAVFCEAYLVWDESKKQLIQAA